MSDVRRLQPLFTLTFEILRLTSFGFFAEFGCCDQLCGNRGLIRSSGVTLEAGGQNADVLTKGVCGDSGQSHYNNE